METTLLVLIAAAFISMLAVNVIFRARVLKAYKELRRAGVEFDATDMLTEAKVEALVARFPQQASALRRFTGGIRQSMALYTGLVFLITALGAVLMYYR